MNKRIATPNTIYAALLFVMLPQLAIADAFIPDSNGMVVMEAENFEANVPQGGHTWDVDTTSGFVGTSAMRGMPDNGAYEATNFGTNSPRLDYEVDFVDTGYLSVWIRGFGHSWSSDSVWISINGDTANAKLVIPSKSGFAWKRAPGGIHVPTTGVHTVNIWFREDGTSVDRILITPDGSYTPSGNGPAESSQSGGSGGNALPVLNSIGDQTVTEGQTLSFTVTASDTDSPPHPALSADMSQLSGTPTFSDNSDGTANFSWTPGAGEGPAALAATFTATDAVDSSLTATETITINVLESGGGGGTGAFLPDANGMVVMEAENFDANVAQGSDTWVADTTAGYVGTSSMRGMPDDGTYEATNFGTASPRLDYQVDFASSGYVSLWVRGFGHSWSSDSVWVSINGDTANAKLVIPSKSAFSWNRAPGGILVPSTGVHTINVWFREDGTSVDRLLITPDGSYTPSGDGPAESSRSSGGGSNIPPVAYDDALSVDQDTSGNVLSVLANNGSGTDYDPDGSSITITAVDATGSANGSVSINSGNTSVLYTPAPSYVGQETFNYTISDGAGGSDSAVVTVTVNSTGSGAPATPTNLSGPATDDDGVYTISWNSSSGAANYSLEEQLSTGSFVEIYSGPSISYDIAGNADGTYTYQVRACDSLAGCSAWSTTHTVTVSSPPGSGPPIPVTVDYTYDALGRLIDVNDSINGSLEYEYDSAGNRTQVSETAATQ